MLRMQRRWWPVLAGILAVGCGDDSTPAEVDAAVVDAGSTDAGSDSGASDAGIDASPGQDASTGDCAQVSFRAWGELVATDVSVEFEAFLDGDTGSRRLRLLFERYRPGPDVGSFELGAGDDANFGNCAHCLFVPEVPGRVYFATAGTLTLDSDPYGRRFHGRVEGLRLQEATVDPATRESTLVEDGACFEVADFSADEVFPPDEWTCPAAQYSDGMGCHCECGAPDPDCAGCDPFTSPPGCMDKPIVDCDAGDMCIFEPLAGSSVCTAGCERGVAGTCAGGGACVPDFMGVGTPICLPDGRMDPARFGENCAPGIIQNFCHVEGGQPEGWCNDAGACVSLCESDADCPGQPCTPFLSSGSGYCGAPPIDG